MQKARRHPLRGSDRCVSAWFQVLFHSAHSGACHHSVALLVHYRSSRSTQAWRVDPPCSRRVSRARRYLKPFPVPVLQGCHLLRPVFPDGSHISWFIRFRSPLLTESLLLSFPLGTEMFQFSRFAPLRLCIQRRVALRPGFPIRTSLDQRSVANSPRLIAGSHVLHRLSTPRHPPCALCGLITPTRRPFSRRNARFTLKPLRPHSPSLHDPPLGVSLSSGPGRTPQGTRVNFARCLLSIVAHWPGWPVSTDDRRDNRSYPLVKDAETAAGLPPVLPSLDVSWLPFTPGWPGWDRRV